jgi:hypothetical protein
MGNPSERNTRESEVTIYTLLLITVSTLGLPLVWCIEIEIT